MENNTNFNNLSLADLVAYYDFWNTQLNRRTNNYLHGKMFKSAEEEKSYTKDCNDYLTRMTACNKLIFDHPVYNQIESIIFPKDQQINIK